MGKYLDEAGLGHLWGKIEDYVNTPIIPVTRAEYDALSEGEREGKLYLVTDAPERQPLSVSVEDYTTEDGWHVRKYSDGYVEMRRVIEKTIPISDWTETTDQQTSAVRCYTAHPIASIPLPLTLTERYSENVTMIGPDFPNWALILYQGATRHDDLTHTDSWSTIRPWQKPTTDITYKFSMIVTGRWK